jgi:predicted ribosome quality control (RQC) complex YloA/Tae2 family protein
VSESENAGGPERLRDVEEGADRVARDAQEARAENERGMIRGEETDYAFRLPPDMVEADRVRSADDVELSARQEQVADTQRQAAETLRRNAELLQGTARELDRAQEAVRDTRDDLREMQQNQEEIRGQVAQAREQVEKARIPEVNRGGDDGGERGNG